MSTRREKIKHRVVISGISGRFPSSNNIEEFQNNLLNKVDCTRTDHGRWEYDDAKVPQCLGIINNVEKFDRVFFGVHSRLTNIMDPTSRMLLEHSFEAIMDAGINPRSLKGSKIGVFTASNLSESEKTVFRHKVQRDGFGIMGGSKAMIPNRISFFLGLTGPSFNVDSDTSGSGTALEHAYHAISEGHCDAAIVGGAILSLHPHVSYQLKCLGMCSPDGKTRSFDDNANGNTRSEGVSILFLQRKSDARRIYQEVVNVRSIFTKSYEIKSCLYSEPQEQIKLMKSLLSESQLSPDDISFYEASGLGIKHVDTAELEAIDAVYGKRKSPLLIGSVKSNIGNPIPASTINSIIKIIIASETGQIPPNVHFNKPNSKARGLVEGRLKVLTELTPWTGPYSVVNATSATGVFSNIILKSFNKEKKNEGIPDDDLPRLIIYSGRTEDAIKDFLNHMEIRPVDVEFLQLLYNIFQSEIDGHLFRGYTIVPAKGLPPPDSQKREVNFITGDKREIWWIFSGMGSQWAGMGEALLKLPVFEAAIRKCDAVLRPKGYDIFKIITDKDPNTFDLIINSFVGIAAIQIGLVDVLQSVGLEPDFIIGHSVGELGCAYADGCFTAEQMVLAALSRGLASVESKLDKGSMAAVGLGYDDIKPLCPPDIDVACHNGSESSTISGPAESMKAFVADLTAKGIFAREVPCSNIAYHSRYIAAAGPNLLQRLQEVIPKPNPRSAKWVSTSVPRSEWNTLKARLSSAEYHTNNLLSPVLFDETARQIPPNSICIEIAPHGLLQAILKRSLPESCVNIPLTRRGHPDNFEVLLTAFGKMYNVGLKPQISNLYPKVEFPVCTGTPSISSLVKWDHSTDWLVNFYNSKEEVKEGKKSFEIDLNNEDSEYLEANVINGKVAIPISRCLVLAWEILKNVETEDISDVVFENIKIYKMLLTVPDDKIIKLTVMLPRGTGQFEIVESETRIVTGTIRLTKSPNQDRLPTHKPKVATEDQYELSQKDFYSEMQMRGFEYLNDFKTVTASSVDGLKGLIRWNSDWVTFLDGALQLFVFGSDCRRPQIPLLIRKIVIDHKQHKNAVNISNDVKATIDKHINYLSTDGMEIQGVKLSILPNSIDQSKLTNDTLNVVPNIDKLNLSVTAILRLILQIVLENTFSTKIPKIQIIDSGDDQRINNFCKAMFDVPEASLFNVETVNLENSKFNKALTVITHDFNALNTSEISQKLEKGRFVLVFATGDQEASYIKNAESVHLKLVFVRKFVNHTVLLLRKKQTFTNVRVVNVSKNFKDVVSKLKNTTVSSENERIAVVIRSRDNVDAFELLNEIETNVNLENIRIFNIQDNSIPENLFIDKLVKAQLELDLLMNILTSQKIWATLRRTSALLNPRLCKNWSANKKYAHNPNNVVWTESAEIENSKNTVKVEYSALNSQDILISNECFYAESSEMVGKNRLAKPSLGIEFSGRDSSGNKVMGLTCGNAMSNYVVADPGWIWNVPSDWSLEDAATVPFAYLIAYSALVIKAETSAGERIMLTNASSGIGLAIIQLATKKECDVFVTYETDEEKKSIKSSVPSLAENRMFKLSDTAFRDKVMLETKGIGVDVAICIQCEVKKLEFFFTGTKRQGRIVFISDLNDDNIHDSIGMDIFLREMTVFSVVPKRVLLCTPVAKKNLANMLKDGINSGLVKPIARTVYQRDSLTAAFNNCVENKYSGKIIVKVQPDSNKSEALALPRLYCNKSKSYLVIEGLTDFGLELIDWLIIRGARHFVVASTKQNDNGFRNLRLKLWKSYGAKIILHEKCDLSQQQNVKILFEEAAMLGPIDAIFDLTRTDIDTTRSSAFINSVNLTIKLIDEESRIACPQLRLLVVCSAVKNSGSLSLIRKFGFVHSESKVQDEIVEEIIAKRKKEGLQGFLIKWGLIDATIEYNETTRSSNVILPAVSTYLQKLDEVLGTEENVVEVSYLAPTTHEVEDSSNDLDSKTLDPALNEYNVFTAGLYEKYGVHVEGFTCLKV